jgi:hypothetical protein
VGAKNHYISRSVVLSGWYVSGGKKGKKSMFSGQISPCFMLFTPNKFLIFNILTGYFHSVFIPLHLCSCPLSQSHPHKMYFVLQNICHIGDKYDDEFCTKFGATRCYEPQVTPYPQEEVDRIYEGIQTLGRETLEALKEYGADRRYGYSWNVLDTAFYQISYFAHPQGQLLNDLDKAVNDMDADLPTEEVVSKGKAFLEKLLAVPKEKLAEDLYYTDTLVSAKRRSSLKNVQENFMNVCFIS